MILPSGKPSQLYDETNPDWAPSLNLGGAPEQPESSSLVSRYKRVQQTCHTFHCLLGAVNRDHGSICVVSD